MTARASDERHDAADRRTLVRQLETERAQLVAAQAVAKVGSWETDLATLDVTWSRETHRIMETDPAAFHPTHALFLTRVHPEDRDAVDASFRGSFTRKGLQSFEHRLLMADGRVKFVEERWQIMEDAAGRPERAIGTCQDVSERQRSLAALRDSYETFNQLANNITDAFWIRSPDMQTVHYVSPAFERIWGRPVTALYENPGLWVEFTHVDDRARARAAFASLTRDAPNVDIEYRIVRPDGEVRWIHARGFQVRDAAGTLTRLTGIVTDIHELKLAALEIARSNRALKMLGRCNEVIVRAEREADLLHAVCDIAVEVGGYRMAWVGYASEAPGAAVIPQAHAGAEDGYLSTVSISADAGDPRGQGPAGLAIRGGEAVVSEDLARDHEHAPWLPHALKHGYRGVVCLPLRSASRTFGVLTLYSAEVQAIREEELALLQRMADSLAFGIGTLRADAKVREQAALLDVAHEAILVRDLDGHIVYWNKGATRIYGYTAEEATGRHAVELLVRDARPFQAADTALMNDGEWQGELGAVTKDDRDITVEAHWTLVRDAAGAPRAILAISTDVTEKKTMEAHFLRAQRMEGIGTLAGGIAHDLNNVLAPILLSVEMLRDMVRNEDDLGVLTTLNESAQRGADLVKQVLSFARGVEGARIPVNPLQLLRDLGAFMRDTFPAGIDVRVTAADGLWTVTGDPTQLHQVLLNLCVNARDAMPAGGRLTIRMENIVRDQAYARQHPDARPGSYVLVSVSDSGTGIPAGTRDRIFEPFFTTKEFGKGTGLGLSTTLAIVRSHGGFIGVESEMGRGTTFTVHLPADPTRAAEPADAGRQGGMPRGHGEVVLVVDDEEAIRKIAGRTLERFGYRVLMAANGAEALEVFAEHSAEIAVVLTDMAMPVLDGPALIAALRTLAPDLRVIGSSGYTSRDGAARASGSGLRHFVPKPYTAESLLQTLDLVLRHSG